MILYDLTSLQRDANRILGFTAQQTLDCTQSLYEKKLVTYPRTDSRYLTDDMREMLSALIASVADKFGYTGEDLRTDPVRPTSVFDSSKVSDHHAIIPTKTMVGSDITGLTSGEKAVLQLISARLLCAAAEDHRYAEMTVKLSSGAEEFTRKGKTVLVPGWKAIWQHFYPEKKKDGDASGPIPVEGTLLQIDAAEVKEGKTSPPKHFTEDTLLSAMETAGADETPDEAERKGLGTPATRAATIEKLVQRGFIERKGDKKTRQLIATDKGSSLITVMPEQIQSASMTAEWEQKLLQVEYGELDGGEFMSGIHNHIVYNSVSMDGCRKFRNFWLSSFALQRVSDLICLENGLSVITPRPYSERDNRADHKKRETVRHSICDDIDAFLSSQPEGFAEFLKAMEAAGYEVKKGKHPAIKGDAQLMQLDTKPKIR